MSDNPFRDLPAVDTLVDQVAASLPRALIVDAVRLGLKQARADIIAGRSVDVLEIVMHIVRGIERGSGTRVINATGVMLHTNLGRAPWSKEAIEAAALSAGKYTNVEIDLDTGERGRRGGHVTRLLRELTGAEDALVVNNNAAAVLLSLAATSAGMAVPVARGELIEIGGSYRLPAVMNASGSLLVEVGTTNRTRIGDYQTALQTHRCGAILKVHPSNYQVTGFTEEASVDELAGLARDNGIPLIYDIGSGLLDSGVGWLPAWLNDEPAARQSLSAGAGLVTFSGDKLLGGPQSGVIVGSGGLIDMLRTNPLTRALRVDGVTYAALAATLNTYLDGEPTALPFWRHALADSQTLRRRSESLATTVEGVVEDGASAIGAGSAPGAAIPSPVIRLKGEQDLFECLLARNTPILTRRDAGDLIIDLRAVDSEDDETIVSVILKCR